MATPDVKLTPRPRVLAEIAVLGVVAGAIVGASTNAVNGLMAPHYFGAVMRWPDDGNVYARTILQGVLEGAGFGLVFSLVFTI
jgi:hypothetical protein